MFIRRRNSDWKFNRNKEEDKQLSTGFLKVIRLIITFGPPAYEIDSARGTSVVLMGRHAGGDCDYVDFDIWSCL
jgi:hypothetical protein